MPLKNHIEKSLELAPEVTPTHKMLMSACAITFPLVVGHNFQAVQPAMFGSLMGLVFFLNDHFGTLKIRLRHLMTTFLCLMLSMWVGTEVQNYPILISLLLFFLSFLLGKSKTFGIELERMILFITLQFMTTSSEPIILKTRDQLFRYSIMTFLVYIALLLLFHFLFRHQTQPMRSKLHTLSQAFKNKDSMRFSLLFAIIAVMSHYTMGHLKLSHPYWVVGTAMIVMLPDSLQGIYKGFQRFVGTVIGVFIAAVLLALISDQRILIACIFVASFLMPFGLTKNYWLGNVFIAALILFFLEIATPNAMASHHLAYWRIVDISLGCAIGILGSVLLHPKLVKKLSTSLGIK